jgi:hypothetical protein
MSYKESLSKLRPKSRKKVKGIMKQLRKQAKKTGATTVGKSIKVYKKR